MSHIKIFLTDWKDAFGAVQSIITAAAIIIGGFIAYLKLAWGRLFTKRLEPSVDGILLHANTYLCLIVKIEIANVGFTRVDIDRDASSLEIEILHEEDYEPDFCNASWTLLGVVDGLEDHDWIEPGEIVEEERLLTLPKRRPIAVNLKLRILPKVRGLRKRAAWNAVAVATLGGVKAADDGAA